MADLVNRVTGTMCCTRKDKSERRSSSLTALHPDPSAVGFDDVFDDRQPQARSTVAGLSRDAEEFIEHARDVLPRNSAPVVAHRELHIPVLRFLDRNLNPPVLGRVLQRVA